MNVFRIRAELVSNAIVVADQFIELIAGLTPNDHIATGKWYGAVLDGDETHPFMITSPDGICQYCGGPKERRYFTIVTRPVKVGEIFELTWANASDLYHYRIIGVNRLNVNDS